MRETAKERREEIEIDLPKLLSVFLGKWWLIALSTVVAAALALLITQTLITPMYSASVTVYVNNIRSGETVEYITNSNLQTAQKLVNTYVNIIKSNTVLDKVAEQVEKETGLELTAKQLRKAMSAAQVEDTEIFNVIITAPDPEMAATIANAVVDVAPLEIAVFVEGSSTKIIDYAKVPEKPSSPSILRNTILGALLGCLAAMAYAALGYMMDVRIKGEEDLSALFDMPVLAQIPSFDVDDRKLSGYGYENPAVKGGAKE